MREENVSNRETMRRENRRVAAMSWGGGDDLAPPKPSRIPQVDNTTASFGLDGSGDNGVPQTYIIAQNPTVLAHLMKENEKRGLNPSAYTTPASVFNTLAVDIDLEKSVMKRDDSLENTSTLESVSLKTSKLPAAELLKLDPIVDEARSIDELSDAISIKTIDQTIEDDSSYSSKSNSFTRYIT